MFPVSVLPGCTVIIIRMGGVNTVYCLGKYDLLWELNLVCFNSIEFNLILFYLIEKNVFGWWLISSELVRGLPEVVTVSGFPWSVVGNFAGVLGRVSVGG